MLCNHYNTFQDEYSFFFLHEIRKIYSGETWSVNKIYYNKQEHVKNTFRVDKFSVLNYLALCMQGLKIGVVHLFIYLARQEINVTGCPWHTLGTQSAGIRFKKMCSESKYLINSRSEYSRYLRKWTRSKRL